MAISSYEFDMLNPEAIVDVNNGVIPNHFHLHEAIHINFYAKDPTVLKMPCVNPNSKRYQSIVDDIRLRSSARLSRMNSMPKR